MKKRAEKNESATTSLIRAVLSTEAKFVIAIVGFVIGVVAPYYQMKEDLALIQKDISIINTNHEAHIQDLTQQIKDTLVLVHNNQSQISQLQTQQAVILDKLTR